jgi:stage III sporulation protein AA
MRVMATVRLAPSGGGGRKNEIERVSRAFECLPPEIRRAAGSLTEENKAGIEEIRLRCGKPATALLGQTEYIITREGRLCGREGASRGIKVVPEHLVYTVEQAANGVIYGAQESIREGYITIPGGHRVGICGHAVTEKNRVTAIKQFSSVCVRIARAIAGIGTETAGIISGSGRILNTLIVSPPLGGKTTLLRDVIRELSARGSRIGIADERGELAGMFKGAPQFDVGPCTDVIDGCTKADGALMLLRGMSPDIIAMDEITAPEDVAAICKAANCGVSVLASAHAESLEELSRRKTYDPLFESGIFRIIGVLKNTGGERLCSLYEVDGS